MAERPLGVEAVAEARVVETPAAQRPHPAEHLLLALREVLVEPALEERRHRPGQAQQGVAGEAGAGVGRRGHHPGNLVIGDRRDDRRHQDARRHSGFGQPRDRLQALAGMRRPRLEATDDT